jgi:hypothetical protein
MEKEAMRVLLEHAQTMGLALPVGEQKLIATGEVPKP